MALMTAFDFGGGCEVDRRLCQVEAGLGQADVLERGGCGDGDDQSLWIGVADVLGGEDHHPPGDEAGIFATLEHGRQVVDALRRDPSRAST